MTSAVVQPRPMGTFDSYAFFTSAIVLAPGTLPLRRYCAKRPLSGSDQSGPSKKFPGQIEFTLMPSSTSSSANDCVSPMPPNLLPAYAPFRFDPCNPLLELI